VLSLAWKAMQALLQTLSIALLRVVCYLVFYVAFLYLQQNK